MLRIILSYFSIEEFHMLNAIKVNLSRQEIIGAVKAMKRQERDAFLEDLLAATSPEYENRTILFFSYAMRS